MKIFKFIFTLNRLRERADKIRSDQTRRTKSAYFAVGSIIFTLLALACAIGGVYMLCAAGESLGVLLMLIFGIALLALSAVSLLWSIIYLIYQFSINRSAWSFIALAVIVAAVGTALAVSLTAFR